MLRQNLTGCEQSLASPGSRFEGCTLITAVSHECRCCWCSDQGCEERGSFHLAQTEFSLPVGQTGEVPS